MSNLNNGGLTRVLNYIKTWVSGLLSNKSDTNHSHAWNDIASKPSIPTYSTGSNLSLSDTTFNVSSTPSFTSITVSGYTITVD